MGEEQDASVVGPTEHEHARPLGDGPAERQREKVCLGSGVAEAHELDRREPRADRLGEDGFVPIRSSEHDPVCERASDRLRDDGIRVAVEARGVLTEEVDILVAVRVGHARPLAVDDRQGEGRLVDGRTRVSARHEACSLLVEPA